MIKKVNAMLKTLLNKKLPEIPNEISEQIRDKDKISLTAFEDKNLILNDPALQSEVGYSRFADGSYLVSMTCPMPDITPEMINWWFWWHPQKDERYKVWFPGEHFGISYSKKDKAYFNADILPDFRNNTQYPLERIGDVVLPLRIDFKDPAEFGFSKETMAKNDIPLIICGHVGAFKGLVWHTEMAHIFKQTEDGLMLISRFWLGKKLKNPLLRKLILTDKTARGMAEHCCVEYRNLAEILPQLYKKIIQYEFFS